ncbi:hypothetical protein BDY19DRAFT_939900 [Irpex rosettiformis]|uniref:Uncharacterized protein n=1 Tax=Irpex rosettiformis TaxID=378272 RepID=A0ACB8U887_9APHY|nr:hypothetical protein BDY19DRAFT_939900 [Irpex rosettiformis]
MSSFSLTTSPNSSRQGRSDPGRIAPFLTNVVTHHGQLTLIPPQNVGRIKKGGKKNLERARTERRRDTEEQRFNIAAPASPRRVHNSERNPRAPPAAPPRFSRDTMIPDYPPPSFQEAMMTPPFIPPPPVDVQENQVPTSCNVDEHPSSAQETSREEVSPTTSLPPASPSPSPSPSTDIATVHTPSQPLTLRTEIIPDADHESPQSHGRGSSSGSDNGSEDSSIELVNLDTDGYDQEQRLRGPLRCRANRIHRRQHCKEPHGVHTPRQVSHLSIDVDDSHDRCSRCGSHKPSDCNEPADQTSDSGGSHSPPSSPKGSKWKRLFVPTGGHVSDAVPMSPAISTPKSPRFGFLPAALASTLTLTAPIQPSPSKPFTNPINHSQKKEPSVMRRIFSPKGKEREGYNISERRNPRDSADWEFIDNKEIAPVEENDIEEHPHLESLAEEESPSKRSFDSRAGLATNARESEREYPLHSQMQSRRETIDHPAFLTRHVRHPPLALNPFPMFSANSSVVSLPLAATAHERLQPENAPLPSTNTVGDLVQESPSLARRQTLSTSHASPSVVWLPLITNDNGSVAVAGAPMVPTTSSPIYGTPPRMSPRFGQEGNAGHLYSRIRSASSAFGSSRRPPHVVTSPLAFSVIPDHEPEDQSPSPTFTESPAQDSPCHSSDFLQAQILRSPASTSTLGSMNTNESYSSPTTPNRHYSGRPLPRLPGPSHPFERAGHTPLFRPNFLPDHVSFAPYPQVSDLDVFAAQVVDDDHDGRRYEDLLRIAEMAGPALSPHEYNEDMSPLPASGRVKLKRRRVMKDGRVKLKLTLMETVVDKCSICLSQFKEEEVACLGTNCPHAFHEYCLKRWVSIRRSCPLCRADI